MDSAQSIVNRARTILRRNLHRPSPSIIGTNRHRLRYPFSIGGRDSSPTRITVNAPPPTESPPQQTASQKLKVLLQADLLRRIDALRKNNKRLTIVYHLAYKQMKRALEGITMGDINIKTAVMLYNSADKLFVENYKFDCKFNDEDNKVIQTHTGSCVICTEVNTSDTTVALRCGHFFHEECLNGWYLAKGNKQSVDENGVVTNKGTVTCPTCRQGDVWPKEGEFAFNLPGTSVRGTRAETEFPFPEIEMPSFLDLRCNEGPVHFGSSPVRTPEEEELESEVEGESNNNNNTPEPATPGFLFDIPYSNVA